MFFLISCKEEEEIQKKFQKIEGLKIALQEEKDHTPYGQTQHETLKAYFSEINQMVLQLKNEEKYVNPLNSFIEKNNLEELCSKTLILKETWEDIMQNCTRNRFFLCAEEVRSYPDILLGFKNHLNAKNQETFDKTPACKDSL
ncbi:MAG: hypothetical protein A3B70_07880 [Deltaproteobacteria bacterium RIFCSPHIGHO2_02_FULL_40_11]|nr:MAG: hypothetical protein A3B70_07880 [Deltaproteobacteria bacterium RIFCSPHIGHO2_02_FULL_40_11]